MPFITNPFSDGPIVVLVRLQVNEYAEQDEDENQTNCVECICHYKPHCLLFSLVKIPCIFDQIASLCSLSILSTA